MNLKAALLLFMIFFASTITTVAMAIGIPTPDGFSATKTAFAIHNMEPGRVELTGDPIDDPLIAS
ncbi:hypothetical protein E3J74_09110 [Candidatus Bathyarchaeota archaeon]|nr:MAG: hypothetical protein E3J74_09110 [Candidatus Bathyarchaeota archaeon]